MLLPIFMKRKRGGQIKCVCDGLTSTPSKVLEQILHEKNHYQEPRTKWKVGKTTT